jgi:hypothetical protein
MQPDAPGEPGPPPPPAPWTGTPAQYVTAMNAAGFTWNEHRRAWDWRAAPEPEPPAATSTQA